MDEINAMSLDELEVAMKEMGVPPARMYMYLRESKNDVLIIYVAKLDEVTSLSGTPDIDYENEVYQLSDGFGGGPGI